MNEIQCTNYEYTQSVPSRDFPTSDSQYPIVGCLPGRRGLYVTQYFVFIQQPFTRNYIVVIIEYTCI